MTRLLLDSHVFIWMHAEPDRLSKQATTLLADPDNELILSLVVPWEIGIKVARKRITLPEPLDAFFSVRAHRARMTLLPIELRHVLDATQLPRHHDDPFDRMLVAQARVERVSLLSADPLVARYEVDIVAA